jgi:hypothetical protein
MNKQDVLQHWRRPEIQNAALTSMVLGGLSSAAAAVMMHHLDPQEDVRKAAIVSGSIGVLTTLASVGYKLYSYEKKRQTG